MTSEFLSPEQLARTIQTVSFISIGIFFIVLLPLILKKRFFCGLICPFGAWQSFVCRIHPFRVSINKEKCTLCGKCEQVCPTMVINKSDLEKGKISIYCNLCGKCIDVCPTEAISYSLLNKKTSLLSKGPGILMELSNIRVIYIFMAILLGGSISMFFVPLALLKLFQ
ncbi:MAG: 4Fe-4S binding protein [bacterium]